MFSPANLLTHAGVFHQFVFDGLHLIALRGFSLVKTQTMAGVGFSMASPIRFLKPYRAQTTASNTIEIVIFYTNELTTGSKQKAWEDQWYVHIRRSYFLNLYVVVSRPM